MDRVELKQRAKEQLGNNLFGQLWLMAVLAVLIVSAISAAIGNILAGVGAILVLGPLSFGLAYLFLKQARDGQEMQIKDLFNGFTTDFAQNFLIGLMTSLFTALWSLLLIVPGIVKAYSYSMAYFVKADHPEYDWKMCMDESAQITRGHKLELFILDLSFLGWLIVGALCLGVGDLWVMAYMQAAKAQAYESIRR